MEEIKVGTSVTEFYHTDRIAYEVVKVVNQKHIFIRKYEVEPIGEMYSNKWKLISEPDNPLIELKFRYDQWFVVNRYNQDWFNGIQLRFCNDIQSERNYRKFMAGLTSFDMAKIFSGKEVIKYTKMAGKLQFGTATYYYDYEF